MNDTSYRRAFAEALTELAHTIAERDERNARITQLKQSIRALGDLLEEDPDQIEQLINVDEGGKPSGITSAVRSTFLFAKSNKYPVAMTAADLKELMTQRGFDFSGQANALASLTTVVRRLKLSEEVEELTRSDGKRAYMWKAEVPKSLGRTRMHADKTVGGVDEK
jgi:hypothetical protein